MVKTWTGICKVMQLIRSLPIGLDVILERRDNESCFQIVRVSMAQQLNFMLTFRVFEDNLQCI